MDNQTSKFIETSVGRLKVGLSGPQHGPLAFMWPSLFTDGSATWGLQLDGLHGLGWRTALVDPPGHGASGPAPREFSMRQCGQAALAILDELGVQRAAFLGVSWGGFVALHVALEAPDRVVALVLSNTSSQRMPTTARMRDAALAKMIRNGFPGGLGKVAVEGLLGARARGDDPASAQQLAKLIDAFDKVGLARSASSVLVGRESIAADIHRIHAPVLLIAGGADQALPPSHAEQIAREISGAQLHIIPEVGHLAPREAPAAFARLLADFLLPTA
jgi:3-oxoadipate enol-lactonase